ncbi:MAG: class A beta-lactamase [Gemmatimonadaceae bacterium]|jgi:beta-lactamase class A|nr:class A beta-lactamase [Gemmatimonadaceae bacterium]
MRVLRLVVPLLAGVTLATGVAAQSATPERMAALTRLRIDADFRADRTALDTLLADDLTYARTSGVLHTKAQVLSLVGAGGPYQLDSSTPDSLLARVIGDIGIVNGLLTVKLTAQPAPYTLRFTDVWARRGRRWQLVAFHASRLPDAASTPRGLDTVALSREVSRLEALVAPARLGVAVLDRASGTRWSRHGREPFPLQSVFKAPLGAFALHQVTRGRVRLEDEWQLRSGEIAPPFSPISAAWPERDRYTVADLIERAAGASDNTAADVLLARLGGPAALTAWLRSLGLDGMRVDRTERALQTDASGTPPFQLEWRREVVFDSVARAQPEAVRRAAIAAYAEDLRDTSTPEIAVDFLELLVSGRLLTTEHTTRLLRIMTDTRTGMARLRAGLPAGATIAHKTGSGRAVLGVLPALNDIGIVTLPGGRQVVIAAFLAGTTLGEAEREAVHAQLMRATVAALR